MRNLKLFFTGGTLSPADKRQIEAADYELKIGRFDLTEAELCQSREDIDVYIVGGFEKVSSHALKLAQKLKVIAYMGIGYENYVDAKAASALGIAVTNTPGGNAQAVAEFTIGLMLEITRKIGYFNTQRRAGKWLEERTINLRGKKLGLVGMGAIARIVAKIARRGFEMEVSYYSRQPKTELHEELGIQYVPFEQLLKESDLISLHIPCTAETEGVIGAPQFEVMKPTAVLINASRARLVDGYALFDALTSGQIAAAAVDGYYHEPAPQQADDEFGLLSLPDDKLIVTPHIAYCTEDSMSTMLAMNLNSIAQLLQTGNDQYVVNPDFSRQSRLKVTHLN